MQIRLIPDAGKGILLTCNEQQHVSCFSRQYLTYKRLATLLLAMIPCVLSAQQIPREIQDDILAEFPKFDLDGDGVFSMKEYKKAQRQLPEKFRVRVALFATKRTEQVKNKATRKLLADLGLKGEQGIEYKKDRQGRTLLDIVYPKTKVYDKAPVLVFVHGGGFKAGFRQLLYGDVMWDVLKRITKEGVAVVTVGYRLAGVYDDWRLVDPHQDVKDALRYLAQNSEKFGIDPHKMILWGQSAGGSPAMIGALAPADHLPGAVSGPGTEHTVIGGINFFGVTTYLEPSVMKLRDPDRKRFFSAQQKQSVIDSSPDKHLKSDSPPLLLFNGELDPAVSPKHGRYMKRLAQKVGADVTYIEVKNAGHGFKPGPGARGELSMNATEAAALIHKHITKWVRN